MKLSRIAVLCLIVCGIACGGQDSPVSATAPQERPEKLEKLEAEGLEPVRDKDPRIVVKVNGDPITMGEINTTANTLLHQKGLSPTTPEGQKELLSIRPNVFNTLLTTMLLKQGSQKLRIRVDEVVLQSQLGEIKKRYPSEKAFLEAIHNEGLSLDDYQEALRQEIKVRTFTERIMKGKVQEPTEDEKRDYYENNLNKFKRPEMVRVSMLVIEYPKDPTEWEKSEAFSLINEIYFKIMRGEEDFGELAKQRSTGPNASNGGDIGYKPRSVIDTYLANAPDYELKVGALTPVLETPSGYVLIYPTDIISEVDISFEQAAEEISRIIIDKRKAENLQRWLDEQMEKTDFEIVDPGLYRRVSVSE